MKTISTFLLFATLMSLSFGETIIDRNCPERPVEKDFDFKKYVSKPWYDLMRYNLKFIPDDCECGFSKYTEHDDKSGELKSCCRRINEDVETQCSLGRSVVSFPDVKPLEGRLNVSVVGYPTDNSNYWVLSTDYDNYSIVHYCQNIEGNKSFEAFWLLSRTPVLNPDVKEKTDELIDKYFDRSLMKVVNQLSDKCEKPDDLIST